MHRRTTIRGSIYYPTQASGLSISSNARHSFEKKWYSHWHRRIKFFLWNPTNKTCMGKPFLEWFFLLIYYIIFFTMIIGLFSLILTLGMKLIGNKPVQNPEIKRNPGLSFRPNSALQHYPTVSYECSPKNIMHYTYYTDSITKFLQSYSQNSTSYRNKSPNIHHFDINKLKNCSLENYGYDVQKPCVYIKMNKVIDWKPNCYKESSELPNEMPADAKTMISKQIENSNENIIWLSCEGVSSTDKHYLGKIIYYPLPGFESHYFPFRGEMNFKSPLVAVQFPEIEPGIVVSVKCMAWAKNIDNSDEKNALHFHILTPSHSCIFK